MVDYALAGSFFFVIYSTGKDSSIYLYNIKQIIFKLDTDYIIKYNEVA
jgi:hypothetical protein